MLTIEINLFVKSKTKVHSRRILKVTKNDLSRWFVARSAQCNFAAASPTDELVYFRLLYRFESHVIISGYRFQISRVELDIQDTAKVFIPDDLIVVFYANIHYFWPTECSLMLRIQLTSMMTITNTYHQNDTQNKT